MTVSGGDISNNTADENGGGIWMTKHSKNSKGTNLKISGGIIHDNNAKNGGGVYVNSGVVFSLYRTYITGNTAKEKAGGIYAGGASINVAETPIVRGNGILSGIGISGEKNLPNSNIYLPSGKKISITGDGLKPYIYYKGTEYEYSEDPILYVSTEKGAANITGNSADYRKYFFSDNPDYASKYADGVMKLVDAYKVTINWTDRPDTIVPVPKDNISKVALPDGEPCREGYLFVGWLLNGEDYNFNKPVTSDITLTSKWLKTGETAVSVNCNEYYVIGLQGKANVYLAAYKMGKLIDLCKLPIEAESYEINTKKIAETGLDITGADKMTVFLWNNTMTPLCESESVSFK